MKISITLPSLHPDCLHKTIENLMIVTKEHELQVLVCSPFRVEYLSWQLGHVVWVEDTKLSGCVAAHKAASLQATGDFITSFADDHSYVDGWDVKAVDNFLRQEKAFIRNRRMTIPFSLGLRQVSDTPHVGTMFGIYYPYFPFMRLADVRALGGWYDADVYVNGFSDPDLGMRVWNAGGRCEWADEMTITTRPEDQARKGAPNYLDDAKTFLRIWDNKYGAGWGLDWVRQWDLDVPLNTFAPEDRTCFQDERVKQFVRTENG